MDLPDVLADVEVDAADGLAMNCPPEHGPHYCRGQCQRCYDRARYCGGPRLPRRTIPTRVLVAQADRLHAELVAAGDYSPVPATWGEVARQLGVKPTTLERARTRAKHYAADQ